MLDVVSKALSEENCLWNRYLMDFLVYKLHISPEDSSGDIVQKILHIFLGHTYAHTVVNRLSSLHVTFHIYPLEIARLVSLLRPLNKLIKVR